DAVGGRVRTDVVEGFRLDRGFQVLQTAYPEARRALDYGALELRPFEPGALVRVGGRFVRVVDPWRRPLGALASAFAASRWAASCASAWSTSSAPAASAAVRSAAPSTTCSPDRR
ncbi:MAG: FAD-dependent oxidoreductase, partial [Planctomycetota bacterium]